jgi:hypothetical protein
MDEDNKLTGLPESDPDAEYTEPPAIRAERTKICDKCGERASRIASNNMGVTAYCSCGHWWAITVRPLANAMPISPPRGLSKETLVEPDWGKAYEDLEGADHDKVGPKQRR